VLSVLHTVNPRLDQYSQTLLQFRPVIIRFTAAIMSSNTANSGATDAGGLPPSSYPDLDATSPTDSVIAGDFGSLSAAEQERQRDEWKSELAKTEDEIMTLKQVLASKEAHAAGLKRRLGITQWREFSEDMVQGLKNLQETPAYKKTAEGLNAAKTKTATMWSSVTAQASASTTGWSLAGVSEKVTGAFGAAKTKVSQSFSHQNLADAAGNPAAAAGEAPSANGDSSETAATKQPTISEEK